MRWNHIAVLLPSLALAACTPTGGGDDDDATDEPTPCEYPEFVDPMEEGEVILPYRWETGIAGDGTEASVDLEDAYCGVDDDIAWSQSEVVLMVSLPAW
ncbi:MAG: hypothetical protein GY898_10310 [Proteobacteria bacterium]|nr:hypothetical protein [Pseudomonadota bacterium]